MGDSRWEKKVWSGDGGEACKAYKICPSFYIQLLLHYHPVKKQVSFFLLYDAFFQI